MASASGTILCKPLASTTLNDCKRNAARNWFQATVGGTGLSVLSVNVPLETSMMFAVAVALAKFSVRLEPSVKPLVARNVAFPAVPASVMPLVAAPS